MFRTIDDRVLVAGQITPADVSDAKAAGVTMIVNNRPDGEEPGQPAGAEIEAAARDAGIGYVAIPVDPSSLEMAQVEAMRDALDRPGRTLAFCRSGTRSTNLWALARGLAGDEPAEIAAKAGNAGYNVSALMPAIERLGRRD